MKITKKRFNVITQLALAEAALKIFEQTYGYGHQYGSDAPTDAPRTTTPAAATPAIPPPTEELNNWAKTQLNHIIITLAPGANKSWIKSFLDTSIAAMIAAARDDLASRGTSPAATTSPLGGASPLAGEPG
jgi:hypothetical protein